jgi:prepilin-type N-terminal cleavage/methylation domain-containing protein
MNGFSLVELLIATAVGLMLMAAAWSGFDAARRQADQQGRSTQLADAAALWQQQVRQDIGSLHQGGLVRATVTADPSDGRTRWLDVTFLRSVPMLTAENTTLAPDAMPLAHDLTWVRYRWDCRTAKLYRSTTGTGQWANPLSWRSNPYDRRAFDPTMGYSNNLRTARNQLPAAGTPALGAGQVSPLPRRAGWEYIDPVLNPPSFFSDRPNEAEAVKTGTGGWHERDLADNDWRWVVGAAAPGVGYPWRCKDDPTPETPTAHENQISIALRGKPDYSIRVPGDEVVLQQNLAVVLEGVVSCTFAWTDLAGRVYQATLDWNGDTLTAGTALNTISIRAAGHDAHGVPTGSITTRRRLTLSGAFLDGTAVDDNESQAFAAFSGAAEVSPLGASDVNDRRIAVLRTHLRLSHLTGTQRTQAVADHGGAIPPQLETIRDFSFSFPVGHVLEDLP